MLAASPAKNILRKTARVLGFALLYVIVICALLELGLRLFTDYVPPGQDSPHIWRYDPVLGWSGRPGIHEHFRQPAFDVIVDHNSLGDRAREFPAARTGKKRLLVLGDSFVWCYGVASADCFVDLLQARHPDWEIINVGLAGTGTDQQYLLLKDRIAYYHPDVVMLLFIQNDFQDNTLHENHDYYKPYFTLDDGALTVHQEPVPTPRLDQTIDHWIYGRSYLYNTAKYLCLALGNGGRDLLGMAPVKWEPYKGFTFQSSFAITQALLNAIADLTEAHQARLIVVHGQMLELLDHVVRQAVEPRGIPVHDLDGAFAGHQHPEYQIPGDAHWNALGHHLVADDLDRYLRDLGVFTTSP